MAALDDLYYLFNDDPEFAGKLVDQPEDRYLVVIGDGSFEEDYRQFGCNCGNESGSAGARCAKLDQSELALLTCPYPKPADAARYLVEGRNSNPADSARRDPGPKLLNRIYMVGLTTYPGTRAGLDAVARAGGTQRARFATDPAELQTVLDQIMAEILADHP